MSNPDATPSVSAQPMRLLDYKLSLIANLRDLPSNARVHSEAQLKALGDSMAEFGIVAPVIINARDDILAGHGRVEAARRQGHEVIPTLTLDVAMPKGRAFALADNRIAELSTWDEEKKAQELRDLSLEVPDLDLTVTGFSHVTIDLAIASIEQVNWSDLDVEPEPEQVPPVTQLGDIFDFEGGHTLGCGDSTQAEMVSQVINGEPIHLVAEDLPYNLAAKTYTGKGKHKHGDFEMVAGELSHGQFIDFMARSFEVLKPHCVLGTLIYAFMDWRHTKHLLEAGERAGFELKNVIVWDKGKASMGALYRNAHEFVILFKYGREPHTNNVMLGKHGRDRHNIWRCPGMNRFGKGRDKALSLHPTVKPAELFCDLILDASHRGQVVFDGFGGSGTTLMAAHKMERRAKLMELSPRYCDVIVARFRNAFGSEPIERRTGLSFSQLAERRAALNAEGCKDGE